MHPAMLFAFALVAIAAGALGYAFRGAIGREIKFTAAEADALAQRLDKGLVAEAKAVATEIREKLAKL